MAIAITQMSAIFAFTLSPLTILKGQSYHGDLLDWMKEDWIYIQDNIIIYWFKIT